MSKKPDFIIGGAMKSGTTTLHHLLSTHAQIFIPECEVHYFCIDDFLVHPPLLSRDSKQWIWHRYENGESSKGWEWYLSFFAKAKPEQLVGEDSTQYLSSALAAERIRQKLPDVKMVFLLRNPVDRAWSQYLHILRSGRALWNFDKMLEVQPATLLSHGLYREHLRRWYSLFEPDRIKIVLFEDLVKNTDQILTEICRFLCLDTSVEGFDLSAQHQNQARFPKQEDIQLWRNRALQGLDRRITHQHFPQKLNPKDGGDSFRSRLIERFNILINPHSSEDKPRMNPATKQLLNDFYRVRNAGLSELIDNSAVELWHDK